MWCFFLYQCRKWSVKNSAYPVEATSVTLNGHSISLPNIPGQIITSPPPCWCCTLVGAGRPFPSRPELTARRSSVNATENLSCISELSMNIYLCELWLGVTRIHFMHHYQPLLRFLGLPETPAASNTHLLVSMLSFKAVHLITFIYLTETFLNKPLSG